MAATCSTCRHLAARVSWCIWANDAIERPKTYGCKDHAPLSRDEEECGYCGASITEPGYCCDQCVALALDERAAEREILAVSEPKGTP